LKEESVAFTIINERVLIKETVVSATTLVAADYGFTCLPKFMSALVWQPLLPELFRERIWM
jgi:hypothetical protein